MNLSNIFAKLDRVRNFPLLGVRLVRAVLPGGFLTSAVHIRKRDLIKEIKKNYGLTTFVETGTNEGDMVEAVKDHFTRIYSIELDMHLFQRASARFANQENISILQGDSAEVLPCILREIQTPALFWLDAHYSGGETAKGPTETPILLEIAEILKHRVHGHIILIDDAWCFGTIKEYPTVSELKSYIKQRNPDAQVKVFQGVIWVSEPESFLSCQAKSKNKISLRKTNPMPIVLFNTPVTLAEFLPPFAEKVWQKIPFGKSRFHPFDAIPSDIKPAVILDVGANEGRVAEAALRTYPQCQVICFEPVAGTFHALQKRLTRYGARVVYFNEALSDVNSQAEINLTSFNGANSLQPQPALHKILNPHVREVGKETITLSRLDDIATKLPAQKIDVMKIDVEGHELKVLQGGRNFIRENVDTIIIEISMMRDAAWSQQAVFDIFALMKELGFALLNVFDLHHAKQSEMLLVQMDCVFRKQSSLRSTL